MRFQQVFALFYLRLFSFFFGGVWKAFHVQQRLPLYSLRQLLFECTICCERGSMLLFHRESWCFSLQQIFTPRSYRTWLRWHHQRFTCRSRAITRFRLRPQQPERSFASSLWMLREDKPCLTPPRPDSHPGLQGQPRSTAEMSERARGCLYRWCWAARLLYWPLDLLAACVLVFSLLLTCMPSFGKKSTLIKLSHLRVHSGFLLRCIRACVCLCF